MRFHLYKMTATGKCAISLLITAAIILAVVREDSYNVFIVGGMLSFPVGWIIVLLPPISDPHPPAWVSVIWLAIQGVLLALNCYFWGFCLSRLFRRIQPVEQPVTEKLSPTICPMCGSPVPRQECDNCGERFGS